MCNEEYIKSFYKEICTSMGPNYKIILEPGRTLLEDWIEYDTVKWEIESPIKDLVDNLLEDNTLSLEKKIMKVYEFICLHYVYDANVLYFFRQDTTDPNNIKYIAVDWYGRVVGPEWAEMRKKHNRRICYEFSRFFAKAINTLIDNKYNLEAVMVGDIENTHYVVGLTGDDYSIILDQDDFNSLKDLTRLKLGLTIKGVHILRDKSNKFKEVIDKYNTGRNENLPELEYAKANIKQFKNVIEYFNYTISVINKFNIDSQGFFECIRAIIEAEGFKISKIWKKDITNAERRHERCLYFEYEGNTYLLDSINKSLEKVKLDDIDKNLFIFNAAEHTYEYKGG